MEDFQCVDKRIGPVISIDTEGLKINSLIPTFDAFHNFCFQTIVRVRVTTLVPGITHSQRESLIHLYTLMVMNRILRPL